MAEFERSIPVTEAKRDLLPIVKQIAVTGESVLINRKGKPAAVLLSFDEYESLQETLEILSDSKMMSVIRKSIKELDLGQWVSHHSAWKE
jgi:prevent-host-death family protein